VNAHTVRVPITVQQPYNAPRTTLTALTVDTSFDEITHPRGSRYVSLRAHATDSAGNTVTQTVLRAYRSR
jgi:hypothetical protein